MLSFKLSMCAKICQQRLEVLVSSKFRERAAFPKTETNEGLYAKARDFKLMCSIDYNNYLGNKMLCKCIKRCKIETLYFRV